MRKSPRSRNPLLAASRGVLISGSCALACRLLACVAFLSPVGAAGIVPFTQDDADAVNSLIEQVFTSGAVGFNVEVQLINGQQMLTGEVNGHPLLPPVPLYFGDDEWMDTSNSGGAALQRTPQGYNKRIVFHDRITVTTLMRAIVHEGQHAFIGCQFPGFGQPPRATSASTPSCTATPRTSCAPTHRIATRRRSRVNSWSLRPTSKFRTA